MSRINDREMEYSLSILIGKCYLFSGKFDMSRVGTRLNLINLLLHFRNQEIIMELSSVYRCDESLLILAESLFQLQVKDICHFVTVY